MAPELSCFPERLRVLLVDDDPVCLNITARMLNHCNHDVVEMSKATDALTKINTLWQHVYRRRMLKNRQRPEPQEANDVDEPRGSSSSSILDSGDVVDDNGGDDHPRKKKIRVRWQGELQEFTDAVQRLGWLEKARPRKILELMNVPDLSREDVTSHLQKCRKQKKPLTGRTDVSQPSLHVIIRASP